MCGGEVGLYWFNRGVHFPLNKIKKINTNRSTSALRKFTHCGGAGNVSPTKSESTLYILSLTTVFHECPKDRVHPHGVFPSSASGLTAS